MSPPLLHKGAEDLSDSELISWILDSFRRTLIHYGCWFREVEYQLGMKNAVKVESEVGELWSTLMLERLSSVLGFEIEDHVPKALKTMGREDLVKLLNAVCVNWLAEDGVWFQAVEKRFGMDAAKRCNDTCWSRFSPYEALRIKELLGLPDFPGIEGLKAALGFRMYARINKQRMEEVNEHAFIFRMIECRVQEARKRKGLPDYPCRSAGMVEYPFFASAIDSRIVTECIGCPPDEHPEEWYCAWKFSLKP
ncbi:MAG: cytosolic protein [Syntrophobacteraceae bacterium]|nr:cytosolic protein [Syntrophobacteraceae bacterium]